MSTTKQRGANPSKKAVAEYIAKLPTAEFTNEYGERFTIHSDGVIVYMSGDEIGAMVNEKATIPLENGDSCIPLFGPNFNIWNTKELKLLGLALGEVASKVEKSHNATVESKATDSTIRMTLQNLIDEALTDQFRTEFIQIADEWFGELKRTNYDPVTVFTGPRIGEFIGRVIDSYKQLEANPWPLTSEIQSRLYPKFHSFIERSIARYGAEKYGYELPEDTRSDDDLIDSFDVYLWTNKLRG